WQAPDFGAGNAGISYRWSGRRQTQRRQVLGMLGEHERAGLENEDTVTAKVVAIEQMLGKRAAERPATDDHEIERPRTGPPGRACQRLVKTVADIPAEHIVAEDGILRVR